MGDFHMPLDYSFCFHLGIIDKGVCWFLVLSVQITSWLSLGNGNRKISESNNN